MRLLSLASLALLVTCLFGGCGGKALVHGPPGDASATDSAVTDSSTGDVGNGCVNVDVSTYDQSCVQDSDCIDVTTGVLCPDRCQCGGSTINRSEQARYQAATASITGPPCHCPAEGIPQCIQSKCTLCPFGPNPPPGCPDGG
jgi:hypothetical protein